MPSSGGELYLTEILFSADTTDASPLLKIQLTARSEFKMARKSDREYLVTIQGAKLAGNHLTLAQYPPQDFDGLTYVTATQKPSAVEVTLGVERGIRLLAFLKESSVCVRSTR